MRGIALMLLWGIAGCYGDSPRGATFEGDAGLLDVSAASGPLGTTAPVLKRLTASQYRHTLVDWFGPDLIPPQHARARRSK